MTFTGDFNVNLMKQVVKLKGWDF